MMLGNVKMVILLNFPLMVMLWALARFHSLDHSSSYHHHDKHDKCSLCQHFSSSKGRSLSLTGRLVLSAIVMVLLLKLVLKYSRVVVPLVLILLCGDVETNPGPYGEYKIAVFLQLCTYV